MLKITQLKQNDNDKTVTLKLEGQVAGEWVNELKRECKMKLTKGNRVVLDLYAVTFIDTNGVETINAMSGDQFDFTGCSLFVARLLKRKQMNDQSQSAPPISEASSSPNP